MNRNRAHSTGSEIDDALVERYSVRVGGRADGQEQVVLVPYGEDLEDGFERAHALLRTGAAVRLIGVGVTVRGLWPAWVESAERFTLSELWAYRARSPIAATAELRGQILSWLREVFEGSVSTPRADEVFYSAACLRVFERFIIAYPDLAAIAEHHGTGVVYVASRDWVAARALEHLVRARGGTVVSRSTRRPRAPWRARILGWGTLAFAATVGEQVRAFVRSHPTRKALRDARERVLDDVPDIWVVLISDWYRFSKIVVQSVALPELARSKQLGILLAASLVPGERSEADMRRRVGSELWPGIGPLRGQFDRCVLDQVVGAESVRDLSVALVRSGASSARALLRIARGGSSFAHGPHAMDLGPFDKQLAILATLEVARATLAEVATKAVLERHPVRGKTVVTATSSPPELVMVDFMLQAAGATTVELSHGSIGTGEPGARECRAQTLCVWNHADARALEPLGRRCIVAGMPRVIRPSERLRDGNPGHRLLFITNYVAPVFARGARHPGEPYQLELLRAADAARRAIGPNAEIRWRPHPADDEESIARAIAMFPGITRSTGREFVDDVAWADVIVCSPSSALFEVMFAGVPVFLHLIPSYAETPAADFMDPSRTFFRAEELEPKLAACVEALRRGAPDVLAPEDRARVALFGHTAEPMTVMEALRADRRPGDVAEEDRTAARSRA